MHARARAFRSYERLKLFALRVAIEEKRVNSAGSAKPQPKLPDQLVWGRVPGSTNHYGPVPRSKAGSGEGSPAPGGASKLGSKVASGVGSPSPGFATPKAAMTPRASAAPSPRGSVGGSPAPAPPAPARSPSVRTAGSGSVTPAAAAPSEQAVSEHGDMDYSGEVGSYEPSAVGASQRPPPVGLDGSRSSWAGLGGGGGGGGSATGSLRGTPRSGAGGDGGTSVGGRSGKRYVTDSIVDEDGLADEGSIPDDVDEGDEF